MDEMNQFEKQLRSWTPRRPSSRVARRLFGGAGKAAASVRPAAGWNWLAPLAACALTMLLTVHTASIATAPLANRNNGGSLFTGMLASNLAPFSLSQMDENTEWNVPPRTNIFNAVRTNR